jgi:hypothetical protein
LNDLIVLNGLNELINPIVFEFVLVQFDTKSRLRRYGDIAFRVLEGFRNNVVLIIDTGDTPLPFPFGVETGTTQPNVTTPVDAAR